MQLEQCNIGSYFRKPPAKRLEILYDNYTVFPRLIECFEKNLKLLIVSEKAIIRNRQRDELGVRVKQSMISSPTEAAAIMDITIENAIETGDFSDSMFSDITVMNEIYDGYTEICVMKAEYEAFSSAFDSMDEEEKKILLPYISKKSSREDIADERGVTTDAVNQRIKRIKKNLKSKVIYSMREYS